ncbi:hypothetical protein [Chryseobacterium sp. JAH]|uniref:hypothetical protein n=1 Tax=Chryseobacterium sp. JAH TaxID=1742858 RepID=UPI00074118F5|nr:hypothetical protein [Chryseobacterium sp. JAH]KUJ50894.1 hypothetical protein AR685_11700 [Chryseobacterium sp. JAH]
MKKSIKFLSVVMVMAGSLAFAQTKVQDDMKQAGMQSLVEVSKTVYDEKPDVFILNVENNDATKLTPYERSLMLEVHSNIKAGNQFGKYETKVLSDYNSYDRPDDCNTQVAAKGKAKLIYKIIKVVVRILVALCDWFC